ncbi:hypothetical protein O181_026579 [Austropuccinia psidii MF-1]|uniref:Uncharacterized protein n=1 Tax=Austropuccinia psidii MF-1 TaxID=1389203 RepID=A0A9Q3H1R6_9BASI|nr:hypothetical protein [Austropuccinia psidii MF-1]
MSPNIPLTTPIASSIDVSGLNIYVGNPIAPTSRTWSIPNISITPIPLNPTNKQMHVSEGPVSTPEISSKANPQSKFPCDFLLNPGRNPVASQEPFGQSKQPALNILSGSQSGLSEGNPGLTLHQNMEPKGKSVQSQAPIEDCEKVTGHHHPYASKPRTAHSSSSREKIVDDEDENMSSNHSETNDESRRDNFMACEEGTQSNSEFTHPQIPLSQSMLEQYKIRQQRNQACKAHNVAKCARQKEKERWLKAELPEHMHGMRSAVQAHCLFLLKVRNKDFSPLPEPPSTEEHEIVIQVSGHLGYIPKDVFNEPSTQFQSQGFQSYCKNELHKLGQIN